MKFLEPYVIRRAIFMFVVLFPVLLVLEYTGHTSQSITVILAGITGGISVVIFPNPEHLKKLKEMDKNDNQNK